VLPKLKEQRGSPPRTMTRPKHTGYAAITWQVSVTTAMMAMQHQRVLVSGQEVSWVVDTTMDLSAGHTVARNRDKKLKQALVCAAASGREDRLDAERAMVPNVGIIVAMVAHALGRKVRWDAAKTTVQHAGADAAVDPSKAEALRYALVNGRTASGAVDSTMGQHAGVHAVVGRSSRCQKHLYKCFTVRCISQGRAHRT